MAYTKTVVSVPDLPAIVRELRDILTKKEFVKYTKAALSKAGRVQAKGVRSGIRLKSGKRKKNPGKFKDSSGALAKAVQFVYRQGQGLKPYVVVGVSKKISVPWKRGKETVQRRPAHYAHLLESGFTAVGRIKGQRGRANEKWSPRAIKTGKFNQTINDLIHKETREKALNYKARYLAARRTKVSGQAFFASALSSTKSEAVAVVLQTLQDSMESVLAKAKTDLIKNLKRSITGR